MRNVVLLCSMAALMWVSGCKQDDLNEDVQSAEDNAQLQTEFAQIYDAVADLAATNGRTKKNGEVEDYVLPSAAVVVFTDTTFSDGDGVDFTVDFGPLDHGANFKGVLCKDGRYRAGKLRVGIDKRYAEIGHILTVATSTSELYYVGNGTNMHKLTGTLVATRTAQNTFNVEVSDATLKRDNGIANWAAEYTVTRTQSGVEGWWGSTYEVTGTSSGNNTNGQDFTATITSALEKKIEFDCLHTYIAGKITVANVNGKSFDIDYDTDGNKTCDRVIKVSVGGKSKEVTLF